ncbi:H-NS histone family protein [Eleftheria terrae]|uniref:H-NS histone family protein n=1 Tax=Eleftheria terrae TaxID=1597781 RepID=UPI00263AB4BC|nr:H-NS histone family protein [Eleftheria terrae]WKB52510.1 H-NS histone family protein [Eleftheria terrae]
MNRRPAESPPPIDNPQKEAALRTVRKLMAFWGLTAKDLRHAPEPVARPPVPDSVRYRHPTTGDTWNGEGAQPDWLKRALLNEGYTVAELRVGNAAPESGAANKDPAV